MDWQQLFMLWGPAMPLMLFIGLAHRDLIYKVIPNGFNSIREALTTWNDSANLRHEESLAALRKLRKEMKRVKKVCTCKKNVPRLRRKPAANAR